MAKRSKGYSKGSARKGYGSSRGGASGRGGRSGKRSSGMRQQTIKLVLDVTGGQQAVSPVAALAGTKLGAKKIAKF